MCLQLGVLRTIEFEMLAVGAVGVPEAVRADVGTVEERTGEEMAIVPLLELDRVRTGLRSRLEEPVGRVEVTLMVVADLGDDEAVARVRQRHPTDVHAARRVRAVRHGLDRSLEVRGPTNEAGIPEGV
jgi:hypothetical protein